MNKAAARRFGARPMKLIIRAAKAVRVDLKSRNTCWLQTCTILCATVGGWLGTDLGEMAGGALGLAVLGPIGGWVAEGGGAVIGTFAGGYLGKATGKYVSKGIAKLRCWWLMRQANPEMTHV